ncbi:MAG: cob(I)yrinic acid a,c-diamide adenosyltransferase [Flavobacteriales bacterium]
MKIYTRSGDKGQTSLLGGVRVRKDHARIEAYGTVDELNSHLGMLRDLAPDRSSLVIGIQEKLFSIGSRLASPNEAEADKFKVPHVQESDIAAMETAMDAMDKVLPEMRNFILPGGHPAVSQAHICRTVCRRAERLVVSITEAEQLPGIIVRYLNRLSDLLFVVARDIGRQQGVTETPWRPKG